MAGDQAPRRFAAVEVPGEVRAAVDGALAPLRRRCPGLRWSDPAGWHLTVAFLGALPAVRVDAARVALAGAAGACPPFTTRLDGRLGSFAGVLWAGVVPDAGLEALAAEVRARLEDAGLPSGQRPFRGHLTLARARGRGRVPRAATARRVVPELEVPVDRLTLMCARPAPDGAPYTVEDAWALGVGVPGHGRVDEGPGS
ncbi:RNA 2',3'-cyclic phosphodiesterase [soil metagenome]